MRTNAITYLHGLARHMAGRKTGYHARELGMHSGTLSQYVACKRGASLAMALRFASYFETTVEDLVTGGLPVKGLPVKDMAAKDMAVTAIVPRPRVSA